MSRLLRLPPLLPFALTLAVSAGAASPVPTMAPDALQPGQKAVVKTVFEGGRVEDFDAEIVGVLKGGRAEGDLILARATSERVIRSGVAQGMSGSPVYVDGRLIGALAVGWTFSREPLFGVTRAAFWADQKIVDAIVTGTGNNVCPKVLPIRSVARDETIEILRRMWNRIAPIDRAPEATMRQHAAIRCQSDPDSGWKLVGRVAERFAPDVLPVQIESSDV